MNEWLKRIIILAFVYGLLLLVPAFFGVLISYTAQPGGISQYNAFLATLLGPWSQILPPNSHPVSTWSAQYTMFARLLTVVLVFSVIGSGLATNRWLRYTAIGIAVIVILVWVLAGLMKVVIQLS